ncbi:general odorant-binding protein 19d [Sitophilus oryzae]|uniref:General odorant-binding protein 19d n=1 Tax=Sitophilus oryzae TaxID=7048 RepID=A0A6J2YMU0_SITOR|nr:general odorant-binding protein 19d [Sitophilus oryzae]
MKGIFVLCCVLVLSSADMTPEQRTKMFNFQNQCMQETGATDEMIMRAFGGDFPDTPVFKEHLVCVGKKGGVIDEQGNYHQEILKKGLMMFVNDEPRVDAMLDKCHVVMETTQDTAYHMAKCLYEEHFGM